MGLGSCHKSVTLITYDMHVKCLHRHRPPVQYRTVAQLLSSQLGVEAAAGEHN
jgi:hypothetical protein